MKPQKPNQMDTCMEWPLGSAAEYEWVLIMTKIFQPGFKWKDSTLVFIIAFKLVHSVKRLKRMSMIIVKDVKKTVEKSAQ